MRREVKRREKSVLALFQKGVENEVIVGERELTVGCVSEPERLSQCVLKWGFPRRSAESSNGSRTVNRTRLRTLGGRTWRSSEFRLLVGLVLPVSQTSSHYPSGVDLLTCKIPQQLRGAQ